MSFAKTAVLSFIATATKMLAGIVINKAIAIYIGPAGLALIGQFQNFCQLALTAGQGAINSGVTKYVAEYGRDSRRLSILFSTASKISITASVIVGAVIIISAHHASLHFLKSANYDYIFIIFGFTLILFVINNLLLSILNGLKEIKTWAMINIVQSIYSLIFTTSLIVFLGLNGAMIALVTNQSVIFFIILWMLRKHPYIKIANFTSSFNKLEAKKLGGFALMAITSAVTVPMSQLIVRNYIGATLGWDNAGYWQAIWYISTMYLSLVTTILGIYYLPRLSEIVHKSELRRELLNAYKNIMPIAIVISILIFLLRDWIVSLLFNEHFIAVRELFLWQLAGDLIKIAAWLIAYLMVAKAMIKTFIVTEILFAGSFVLLSIYCVNEYGLVGMSYSFALNCLLYLLTIICSTKRAWSDE
jgi:O-antigen/teichoic acid export membrane protein